MKESASNQNASTPSRRQFVKGTTAAVVAGGLATNAASGRMVHSGVDETLKVGLIGCGGRG
ncbi:MAG: twin-arginine translocation signal domain-containing protein, partial [Planctomycetota bacterium]|nr:twin-arginine translocation signal domain-containing protein [Planctomycetota bacterium]